MSVKHARPPSAAFLTGLEILVVAQSSALMATGFGRSSSKGCKEAPISFPVNPKASTFLLSGGCACLPSTPARPQAGLESLLRVLPNGRPSPLRHVPPHLRLVAIASAGWAHWHPQEPISRPWRASQDGPWAVTRCSAEDEGGPWPRFFALASQCFLPWDLFVSYPTLFSPP